MALLRRQFCLLRFQVWLRMKRRARPKALPGAGFDSSASFWILRIEITLHFLRYTWAKTHSDTQSMCQTTANAVTMLGYMSESILMEYTTEPESSCHHRSTWSYEGEKKTKGYSVAKNAAENQISPGSHGSTRVQKWTRSLKQLCSFHSDTVDLCSKQSCRILITRIILMV